ncbi:hypothetical protein [Streptacidiphilus monticola]|uniref:Xaa-Pro dipeptidyl-peptidase C-terminal domain-containing protein n=1 Tax=Streptacidiphilus monticola TaxID=2161674 RepID=A0ABW1GD97_9ACTN
MLQRNRAGMLAADDTSVRHPLLHQPPQLRLWLGEDPPLPLTPIHRERAQRAQPSTVTAASTAASDYGTTDIAHTKIVSEPTPGDFTLSDRACLRGEVPVGLRVDVELPLIDGLDTAEWRDPAPHTFGNATQLHLTGPYETVRIAAPAPLRTRLNHHRRIKLSADAGTAPGQTLTWHWRTHPEALTGRRRDARGRGRGGQTTARRTSRGAARTGRTQEAQQ